jgi:hypothetical protein
VDDINKAITKRFIKEIRIKGWTKEKYNKEMGRSPRWITRMETEKRDWTVNNFMNSCRLLGVAPSAILQIKIRKKDLCDMTIKEILQIVLKEHCNDFIESNPDKISMILDFIKLVSVKKGVS